MKRNVSADLVLVVQGSAEVELQVSVAERGLVDHEKLDVTDDGGNVLPLDRVTMADGTEIQRFTAHDCTVKVRYTAAVSGDADRSVVTAADRVSYRRPSRYAESDRFLAIAQHEFGGINDPSQLLSYAAAWVGDRLSYVSGSSLPTDGAITTLLRGSGVCRDYAHLVVALLRALDVPARVAAVYAPGLSPMDFHAVAEAAIDGMWQVADATLLAPRSSLVRICSGRDAADTAFLTSYGGNVSLDEMTVTATADQLPGDDPRVPAWIT